MGVGGIDAVERGRRQFGAQPGELAVEQLTRYLAFIREDPAKAGCRGILAAQQIKPQARTLAGSRRVVSEANAAPDLTLDFNWDRLAYAAATRSGSSRSSTPSARRPTCWRRCIRAW